MSMNISSQQFERLLDRIFKHAVHRYQDLPSLPALPPSKTITAMQGTLSEEGIGLEETLEDIFQSILPRLSNSTGPRFFALVTGGVTPAALLGDILTPLYDQNVILHAPSESFATTLEHHTLGLLLDLFRLPRSDFRGGTLTTGATSSNLIGLSCARQWLGRKHWGIDIAEDGFCGKQLYIVGVKVHSSVLKSASIVGIGRKNYIDVGVTSDSDKWEQEWDLFKLEEVFKEFEASKCKAACVVVGFGEVNTGAFASQVPEIRKLCNEYGAWLHIDAAFGALARITPGYEHLAENLELADSITADAHKSLNVPYDCGIFFTRFAAVLEHVYGGLNAAYLETSAGGDQTPHPMNVSIENSRRFRALPLYMSLKSYGAAGYRNIFHSNCSFANMVHSWIQQQPQWYEVLSPCYLNIVLFRAIKEPFIGVEGNNRLLEAINGTKKICVSKTQWNGVNGLRIAVSNWRTDYQKDFDIVIEVLTTVMNL